MQLPRPDDLTWRTAGFDIRHAPGRLTAAGAPAQNPGGDNAVAAEPTSHLDPLDGGCASGAGDVIGLGGERGERAIGGHGGGAAAGLASVRQP